MKTDPALEWAARVIVLNPDRSEYTGTPVIHAHRNREMELPQRRSQQVPRRTVEIQSIRNPIELGARRLEGVCRCRHTFPNRRSHRLPLVYGVVVLTPARNEKDRAAASAARAVNDSPQRITVRHRTRVAVLW